MKKLLKTLLCAACISCVQELPAQTLHAVIFCNTNEKGIGCPRDFENIKNEIQLIRDLIGYEIDMASIDGPKCTREIVHGVIQEMDVEPDDVILTYYSGHGAHAKNNRTDRWPQYCMNTNIESKWLPMATVDYWVAAKKPRLSIVVSDCCNAEEDGVSIKPLWGESRSRSTSLDEFKAENYKKLFAAKGKVLVTSSKLGQYSAGDQDSGGLFTRLFLKGLRAVGKGNIAPDWETLLSQIAKECGEIEIRYKDSNKISHQNPDYQVLATAAATTQTPPTATPEPTPTPSPTPSPVNIPTSVNTTNLLSDLAILTNKSLSEEARLDMIPSIISKHFDSDAMVITVGNDMQTQYEYERVRDFLRRICLSPYIKSVNVINESRTLLKVHEIR